MLCLPQGQSPTVLQDSGGAVLVQASPLHLWSLPSSTGSRTSCHSISSLALCLAVVLIVYLVPSFLVAPLAQICAPVALSQLCVASRLGSAMWILTQHPAQCDSNVSLVTGRGAPFHSVTWRSHCTIAGTCAGGGGPHRRRASWSTPHYCRSMALSHGIHEPLKNEVQVPCQPGCSPAALNLHRGAGSDAETRHPSRRCSRDCGPPLKGLSINPGTEKDCERNWTQVDCNGPGPTSAQLQIFWGSGHHRLTYPCRHSESAIALIPMYNSGIDRLRRLKPNLHQSC